MKRNWKACLCIAAFLLAVLPVSASADMGPKPQITIQVQNAPDGDYYVDLLIPGEVPERCIDNIEWNHIDRASLPLDALERDRMDGWPMPCWTAHNRLCFTIIRTRTRLCSAISARRTRFGLRFMMILSRK